MSPRSSVMPVVASGVASAAKLLVAVLAFTGAYVGVGASNSASDDAPQAATGAHVQTITLTSRVVPMPSTPPAGRDPEAGEVTVDVVAAPACDRELRVRSLVGNPEPEDTIMYGWRLQRWSAATRTWKLYLAEYAGFTGEGKVVEWRPNVVHHPGWYRVELAVTGAGRTHSDRLQISC